MDADTESDQRLEHHQEPPKFIELSELKRTTGVEYFMVYISHFYYINIKAL